MKFFLVLSLLLFPLFISHVQGIRLGRGLKALGQHDTHEEGGSLVKGVGSNGRCQQEHSKGNSRKIITHATTSTTTLKINQQSKQEHVPRVVSTPRSGTSSSGRSPEEKMDIAEMDYSPARRKAPIHN